MWMSAYLVIVVGIIQFGLAVGWQRLGAHGPLIAALAFAAYNLGNTGVILGRTYTGRSRYSYGLVRLGGLLLATAMILLLVTVRPVALSWTSVWFCTLIVIILVSMPVGVVLSRRRHSKLAKTRYMLLK